MFETFLRVYYEDTDAGGVVYHSNYLNYMERCRSDWLRQIGWDVKRVHDELAIAFAVAAVNMQYLAPARLNDELRVTAELQRMRRLSFDFLQHIYCGERELCRAQIKIAAVSDRSFEPVLIPKVISDEIHAWKQP